MTIIEEVIIGLFHHQSIAASLGALVGPQLQEKNVGILIMLLVLIPYCAFYTLDEALGQGRLAQMFSSRGSQWSGGNRLRCIPVLLEPQPKWRRSFGQAAPRRPAYMGILSTSSTPTGHHTCTRASLSKVASRQSIGH